MEDLDIIKNCKNNDFSDFWELYDKYIDKIYNFIYLKVYNREIAEDITSDVFYKLLEKVTSIDTSWKYTFSSWIYKVAYNKVIDFYRTKKDELDIDELYDIWVEENIWKKIDDKDKLKEVFNYINALKPEHKEVLIMRLWDNLSYAEISEITWKSVDNCKQIFSRNIKKINTDLTTLLLILLFL